MFSPNILIFIDLGKVSPYFGKLRFAFRFYRLENMKINRNEIYWNLVTKCLIEIFGITPSTARRKSLVFRKETEALCKSNQVPNLIYHESPVQIASEIIGVKLLKSHLTQFQKFSTAVLKKENVIGLPTKKTSRVAANDDIKHPIAEKRKQKAAAANSGLQSKVRRAKSR